jgi:hypothetical protein
MGTHFFWDPVSDNIIQERNDDGNVTVECTTEPARQWLTATITCL